MPVRHQRGRPERVPAKLGRCFRIPREGVGNPAPALVPMAARIPEDRERGGESQLESRLIELASPLERCPAIVVLQLETREPHRCSLIALEVFPCLLRERQEEVEMAPPDPIQLAALLEPLERVLADRLQHREAIASATGRALLSTSAARLSRSAAQTASAASSVKPPAKTASRAKSCLLGSSSSS